MTDTPLVSVVVIAYNHVQWIDRAMENIIRQTRDFALEIIVGDDCSTDGTRARVGHWAKEHPLLVRPLLHGTNLGGIHNLVACERAARGKYLAYCEADDFWHCQEKLAKQVKVLESNPHVGLVHSEVRCLNPKTGKINERLNQFEFVHPPVDSKDLFTAILNHEYRIRTCSVLARRELIRRAVDRDPELFESARFSMGDTPRWLELSKVSEFAYVDEPLATYRLSPNSVSRPGSAAKEARFYLEILDLVNYMAQKHAIPPASRRAACRKPARAVALRLFQSQGRDLVDRLATLSPPLGLWDAALRAGVQGGGWRVAAWPVYWGIQTGDKVQSVIRWAKRLLHEGGLPW